MYKLNKTVLTLILWIAATVIANSQCLPPPPIIENVTVMPNATGDVTVKWHENPNNTCTTTGYEVYKYNYSNGQFELLSFAPFGITAVLEVNAGGNVRPQIYRMTTEAGNAPKEHSENHHTMYLNPVMRYDPCYLTASALWTPYKTSYRNFEIRPSEKKFNDSVKYQIIGYIAPAGSPFNLSNAMPLSEITSDTTTIFPMLTNQNYLFCVKAFLPNGFISYSNFREGRLSGNIPNAPKYIYLDSIVSFNTHNHLHFEIDNSTQMTKFQVERTTSFDSVFKIINTFSDKNTTSYNDNTCDINKKYFYRITAFNSTSACDNIPAKISDTLNSTVVNVKYAKPNANVSWSEFIGDADYTLYRNGMSWVVQYGNTQYTDMDVQNDYQNNNIYDFCYKIVVTDRITDYTSTSRECCISLNKPVIMPNAVDPTSIFTLNTETVRRRNQFAPIIGGSDLDYEYHMIIFNRWNNVIFETTKPIDVPLTDEYMWHGTSINNQVLPEDTYLYYVKVTFKNPKRVVEQRGSVNVIYQ